MRKWEIEYEKYKSGEKNEEFEALKKKIDEKQATAEEVKEYKRMERIFGYMPNVENLKAAIEVLETNLDILKDEWNTREAQAKEVKNAKDKKRKLENKISDIEAKLAIAEQEVKNSDRDDEDFYDKIEARDKLEDELKGVKDEIKINEEKMPKSNHPELANMDKRQLRKEIFKTSAQIGKCHFAARLFMEGRSKQNINIKVNKEWKDRKFTAKSPLPKSRKEIAEEKKEQKKEEPEEDKQIEEEPDKKAEKLEQSEEELKEKVDDEEKEIDYDEEDKTKEEATNLPMNSEGSIRNKVQKEHVFLVLLTKIPFLKKYAENKLQKFVDEEKDKTIILNREPKGEEKPENVDKAKTTSEEFRAKYSMIDYDVMDIAEKGLAGIEKEKQNKLEEEKRQRMEQARETLKQNREKTMKEEEKYGKGYADQSRILHEHLEKTMKEKNDGDER